jgi:hypothetical protein
LKVSDAKFAAVMHRLGVILLVSAAIAVIVGLVAGFSALFTDHDDVAKMLLALVPIGFITGFAGIVTTLMFPPEN